MTTATLDATKFNAHVSHQIPQCPENIRDYFSYNDINGESDRGLDLFFELSFRRNILGPHDWKQFDSKKHGCCSEEVSYISTTQQILSSDVAAKIPKEELVWDVDDFLSVSAGLIAEQLDSVKSESLSNTKSAWFFIELAGETRVASIFYDHSSEKWEYRYVGNTKNSMAQTGVGTRIFLPPA